MAFNETEARNNDRMIAGSTVRLIEVAMPMIEIRHGSRIAIVTMLIVPD